MNGDIDQGWNLVLPSLIQGKPILILSLQVSASIECIRYIRD